MSIYSDTTEQDIDFLLKLGEQLKNQQAIKNKNRILNQTHNINLAESLLPIIERN